MKRKILLLFVLFWTVSQAGWAYPPQQTRPLRVCLYENAPKIYTDEQGNATGFWPELLTSIAEQEGWQIEWVAGDWADCLRWLTDNQIDILPDTGWTEERSRLYAFSQETVLISWTWLYVPRGSEINSILDLEGKTVGALADSFNLNGPGGLKDLTQRFGVHTTFIEMDNYTHVFEMLERGGIDGGITNKDFGNLNEGKYRVVKTPIVFQPARIQFAFPKDGELTAYLIERIDSRMRDLKSNNTSIYYQALERYLGEEESGIVRQVIPRWVRNSLYIGSGLILFLIAVGVVSHIEIRRRIRQIDAGEAKYRRIFEGMDDGYLYVDLRGTILTVNPATAHLLGYASPKDLEGKDIVRDVYASPGQNAELQARLLREDKLFHYEMEFRRAGGGIVLAECNLHLLRDDKGNPLGIEGTFHDITEHKRAEEQIRYQAGLIESMSDAIISTDLDFVIRSWNSGAEAIYGWAAADVMGRAINEVLPTAYPNEDRAAVLQQFRTAGFWKGEAIQPRRDGTPLSILSSVSLSHDGAGNPTGAVAVNRDISARKQAEASLREEQRFTAAIADTFPAIIYVYDMQSQRNVYSNAGVERLLGYSPAEIQAMGAELFTHLVHPDDLARVLDFQSRVASAEDDEILELEYRMRHKSGEWCYHYSYERPFLRNVDGSVQQKIGIAVEVTDRRRLEDLTRESEAGWKALVDNREDFIWSFDREFRFISFNQSYAKMYLASHNTAIAKGMEATAHLSPEEYEFWSGKCQPVFAGESIAFDFSHTLDGSLRHFRTSLNPIYTEERVTGVSAISTDITSTRQAEAERTRLLNALEVSLNEIFMFDAETLCFRYMNEGARRNLGYSAEKLQAMTPVDIKPEFSEAAFQTLIEPLRRHAQEKLIFQTVHRRADGTLYPVEVHLQLIEQADDSLFLAVINDITQRKQAEEALHASESRYRLLFENMQEGFSLQEIITDEAGNAVDFRILHANRSYARHTGIDPQAVIGKTALQLQPGVDRRQIEAYGRVALAGETLEFDYFSNALGRHFFVRAYRFQPGYFATIFEDITERKQAERMLRESRERLVEAERIGRTGNWSYTVASCQIEWSAGMYLIYGRDAQRERVTYDLLMEWIHPEDRERHNHYFQRMLAMKPGDSLDDLEYRLFTADGEERWVQVRFESEFDDAGSPSLFFGSALDITQRKRAEDEIRLHLGRLTALNRAALQLQKLQSPRVLADEIIKSLESILNYTYSAVLLIDESNEGLLPYALSSQGHDDAFVEEDKKYVASQDIRVWKGITGWVAQTGEKVRLGNVQLDARYFGIREDIHSELCVPLRSGGRVIGVVNIESTQADAYSANDEYVLETVAAQVSIAIQNAQLFEQIQKQSAELEQRVAKRTAQLAQLLHQQSALAEIELAVNQPDEVSGVLTRIVESVTNLLPASGGASVLLWDRRSERFTTSASTVPGQPSHYATGSVRHSGGGTRWIVDQGQPLIVSDIRQDPFTANPMLNAFGLQAYAGFPLVAEAETIGVLYTLFKEPRVLSHEEQEFIQAMAVRAASAVSKARLYEEVTDANRRLKAQASLLQAANKELETFSYSVSHDLRAPLRAISGFAEIIARRHRADLNPEGQHYFENIVQASARMGHLIDDLLSYSRLGRGEIQLGPVSLAALLQEISNTVHSRTGKMYGILEIDENMPTIRGDRTLLGQIFTNLLENALKYHRPPLPPQVNVDWYEEDIYVVVRVRDNGLGIPLEYQDKIFDIFQRLHSEEEYPGTGIGLATVKKAVTLLGGAVWVESQVGEGSTFFVKLPKG